MVINVVLRPICNIGGYCAALSAGRCQHDPHLHSSPPARCTTQTAVKGKRASCVILGKLRSILHVLGGACMTGRPGGGGDGGGCEAQHVAK